MDKNKHIFVVEGPIDSLFLDNCIAVAGADFMKLPKENTTVIFDNERRNLEVLKSNDTAQQSGELTPYEQYEQDYQS